MTWMHTEYRSRVVCQFKAFVPSKLHGMIDLQGAVSGVLGSSPRLSQMSAVTLDRAM